jgi:hypothetical protein
VGKLSRISSVAARSPWSWPIAPLVAVAAVGQWRGTTAAVILAAGFGAVAIGIAIGLSVAGGRAGARHTLETQSGTDPPKARSSTASLDGASSTEDITALSTTFPRTVDLRGARLTNTTLVRADLRQADLRGATLMGADLSGADLTGARLGPLDDNQQTGESE